MITLNGEPVDFAGTLDDRVRQRAGVRDGIAVAVDHAVVPRSGWGDCWVGCASAARKSSARSPAVV